MEPIIKFLFLFALLAVHLPSPAEGERYTRYINYYYKYRYYNRYSNVYSVPAKTNGTVCSSSCIAGSVFTTIATQPCLICCLIVVAYFLCKCSCAACNGVCKSSSAGRVDTSDAVPVIERSRPIRSVSRRDRSAHDVLMMTVVEDTPPPYSPEMEKLKRESDKVVEEKPPEYGDIYTVEAYPAQD